MLSGEALVEYVRMSTQSFCRSSFKPCLQCFLREFSVLIGSPGVCRDVNERRFSESV